MKFTSIVSATVLLAGAASASNLRSGAAGVDHAYMHARHNHHADLIDARGLPGGDLDAAVSRRNVQDRIVQRHANSGSKKKCKAKTAQHAQHAQQHHDNNAKAHKAEEHKSQAYKADTHKAQSHKAESHTSLNHNDEKKSNNENKVATSNQKQSSSSSSSSSGSPFSGKGLFGMSFAGSCSSPNADDDHPNGKNNFLACGISQNNPSSIWNPPNVKLTDLKMISSDEAASKDVFKPCAQYKWAFDQAAKNYKVPAVLLMSFALQESTCQASLMGNNGEVGMMQITKDKCEGRSTEACKDVSFNVNRGAAYVREMLDANGGNALAAFGAYNGWTPNKMTYSSATSRQWGCYAQNNLDYLNSLLNGFCQGKDGHSNAYKVFGNLAACDS